MFCFSRFSVTLQPPLVMSHKHILWAPLSSSHSLMFVFRMHAASLLDMEHGRMHHRAIKCNPCTCCLNFKDIITHVCLKLIDNALGNILTLVQNTAISKIVDYLMRNGVYRTSLVRNGTIQCICREQLAC